jgi:hypothetical protein
MENFFVVKKLPETTKFEDFSTYCLLIWNPVVSHETKVLEFAQMVRPQ